MSKPRLPPVIERKLGRHKADGLCWDDGTIEIDPRLKGKRRLETLIHEMLHHRNPHWIEEKVETEGEILARFLWKHGIRTLDTLPANK